MPVVWRRVRADLLDTETLCMSDIESALKLIGRWLMAQSSRCEQQV